MQIAMNTAGMMADDVIRDIRQYLDRHGHDAVRVRYCRVDRGFGDMLGVPSAHDATLTSCIMVVDAVPRTTTA